MPVYIVDVEDEVIYARKIKLIIEAADKDTAQQAAINRCEESEHVEFDEKMIDSSPYEATVDDSHDGLLLADLLKASRDRVGPLDHDERAALDRLRLSIGVSDKEIFRFNWIPKREI